MTNSDKGSEAVRINGLVAALSVALAAIGCGRSASKDLLARGTIELPEVDLSASTPARVVAIRVDEGAEVHAGDTVVLMSQAELPPTIAAERARVAMTESQLKDLERGARPAEVARAEADVAAARAESERTAKDAERIKSLASQDVVSRQQLDQALAAARVAAERQRSAEQALDLIKQGTREDRIRMARSELANARAALGTVEARASDLVLTAPVAGRVLSRQAEPGEMLPAGVPAITLGEIGRPYVRVYVPASRLAQIRIGDTASVAADGLGPDAKSIGRARVVAISPKAEFTPRVALTEQERADLMFGVKLELIPPHEGLHPGLWVAVTFASSGGTPTGGSRQ